MLHSSLRELGLQANRCESTAAARGILSEAQELLRNALRHRESETELTAWFSRLVSDVVRSPAIASPVRLTGAVSRGDAIPSMPITWLGEDEQLLEILESVGLKGRQAEDEFLAWRVDAGYPVGIGGEQQLLHEALSLRPPALKVVNGLPDPDSEVDIESYLLAPIAGIARWAAPSPRPTLDRLEIAIERQLLSPSESQSLAAAWETAVSIAMRRWLSNMDGHSTTLDNLPALDRTAYGAACRLVAQTFAAISARYSQQAPGSQEISSAQNLN